ncbi:DGQHR domain-containing protein [Mesorhizobium sp. VNQ89]|uniref:DGQHR domain-containing protein n=1 Tax=Mesorhizobium quangtriensis TaxID=3157709 RepID=UPI0032B76784
MPDPNEPESVLPPPKPRSDLVKEYNLRRKEYIEKRVPLGEVQTFIDEGWSAERDDGKRAVVRKRKAIGDRLEDRFWCALYKMGYDELSPNRTFNILVSKKNEPPLYKQVDVFAKDSETIIIAECKSCSTPKKRSLQKDLNEFIALKGAMATAVKKHYPGFKPKIIWMFVTENVIWSKPDLERARQEQIQVMKESEYRYFSQIVDHLGPGARPQFLAEYLRGTSIAEMEGVTTPAIRGTLGGNRFYAFVATPEQLIKIAFVNHRALNDPEGAPAYQRLIQKGRLKQIAKFLGGGGYFPNSILMNFKEKVRFDLLENKDGWPVQFGTLYLPSKLKSAWIIDGQHRLYAYGDLDKKRSNDNLIVVAFEKLGDAAEANLFVTINHEQKRVPKNLLDELEGELKWGSSNPKERISAIGSRIWSLLNGDNGSPFYGRVATPGLKQTEDVPLTMPEVKGALVSSGLIGQPIFKGTQYGLGPLCDSDDKSTLDKASDALTAYFSLLAEASPERWARGKQGYLCSNISVGGNIRLLAALIAHMAKETGQDPLQLEGMELVEQIESYLAPVIAYISTATDDDYSKRFKPQFGSGGIPEHFYRLSDLVSSAAPSFSPPGLSEWRKKASEDDTKYADDAVKRLQTLVHDAAIMVLKKEYGDKYLIKGVSNDEILKKAYPRQLEDAKKDEQKELDVYFDLLDFKDIVGHKQNKHLFKEIFDIEMKGDKGLAFNLRWMEVLNSLRRIAAHPAGRQYKPDDIDFLRWLDAELQKRTEVLL